VRKFCSRLYRRDISQLLRWLAAAGATLLTVSASIYSNSPPLPPLDLPSCGGLLLPDPSSPSAPPYSRVTRLTCGSLAPHFFLSVFLFLFAFSRVSFRYAREPLISADFARRADPWNLHGYLSPGGSFCPSPTTTTPPPSPAALPPLPFLSYAPSRVPPRFSTRGPLTAPRLARR